MRKRQEIGEYVTFTVVPSSEDDINVKEELTNLSIQFKDSDNDELFAFADTHLSY